MPLKYPLYPMNLMYLMYLMFLKSETILMNQPNHLNLKNLTFH